MKFAKIMLLLATLVLTGVTRAEYVCNERVFLNANEEEVFANFPGMVEVSIFSLLADPREYENKAITVRAQLATIDSFYVLVPPDSPSARIIPASSVRVILNKPVDCFLKENNNEMVILRGRFQRNLDVLMIEEVYYAARLMLNK